MKTYIKPAIDYIELRPEESIACFGSVCNCGGMGSGGKGKGGGMGGRW